MQDNYFFYNTIVMIENSRILDIFLTVFYNNSNKK